MFSIVADWVIADMLAIRQNALGHVRYVLKDGLKWLPLYGWYFSQVEYNINSRKLSLIHKTHTFLCKYCNNAFLDKLGLNLMVL